LKELTQFIASDTAPVTFALSHLGNFQILQVVDKRKVHYVVD